MKFLDIDLYECVWVWMRKKSWLSRYLQTIWQLSTIHSLRCEHKNDEMIAIDSTVIKSNKSMLVKMKMLIVCWCWYSHFFYMGTPTINFILLNAWAVHRNLLMWSVCVCVCLCALANDKRKCLLYAGGVLWKKNGTHVEDMLRTHIKVLDKVLLVLCETHESPLINIHVQNRMQIICTVNR